MIDMPTLLNHTNCQVAQKARTTKTFKECVSTTAKNQAERIKSVANKVLW